MDSTRKCKFCDNVSLAGGVVCGTCMQNRRNKQARTQASNSRNEKTTKGLCFMCGNDAVKSQRRKKVPLCEKCYLKRTATTHFGNKERWMELHSLYEQQSVCPYTGIKLKLGVDTSLDHKIPISKGGTNLIDNLQWVFDDGDIDINMVKCDLTDSQFRFLVERIADNIRNQVAE